MEAPTSSPKPGQELLHSKPPNIGEVAAAGVATAAEQDGKKRKLNHDGFCSSKYFKICSIVKELRPFFVEVSRTPNFRDGKVAHEIQIRMKTLVELTKQLRSETSAITKCSEIPAKEPLSAVVKEENIEKQQKEENKAPQPQPGENPAVSVNAMENGIRGSLEESVMK